MSKLEVPVENIPRRIEIDLKEGKIVDVTYYFEGSKPWSAREFGWGTPTRKFLESLEDHLEAAVDATRNKQ